MAFQIETPGVEDWLRALPGTRAPQRPSSLCSAPRGEGDGRVPPFAIGKRPRQMVQYEREHAEQTIRSLHSTNLREHGGVPRPIRLAFFLHQLCASEVALVIIIVVADRILLVDEAFATIACRESLRMSEMFPELRTK